MNSLDIENFLRNLTTRPGVYSMLDADGKVIYVGKAKNLKKRVTSYFQRSLDSKTLTLVKQIQSIEVTVTRNEREALLLESNLIKQWMPKYNVIFKDDKSYPYLHLSTKDPFPRLCFYRGDRTSPGKYYGPYPSAKEARNSLTFLQGIFKLRQCDNGFFKSRTRPCLQYQIRRCTAPCVGLITEEIYQEDVKNAILFLEGKSDAVIKDLFVRMEESSNNLDFERASRLRDQIAMLRRIQEQQIIVGSKTDADVLGVYVEAGMACIHLLVIREGRMLGSRHYFPNTEGILTAAYREESAKESSGESGKESAGEFSEESVEESAEQELLYNFMLQHYLKQPEDEIPKEIIIPCDLESQKIIEELLGERSGHKVRLRKPEREGLQQKWLEMARNSAEKALETRFLPGKQDLSEKFAALQEALQLEAIPERIECFDVSHTLGEATVAACVVFDSNGPLKNAYRCYNIKGITPGDDYAALKQALTRRYTRLKSEGQTLSDILLIDGGKGQITQALSVLKELQVTGVIVLGIAKGPDRKPGLETIYRVRELHCSNGEIPNVPNTPHPDKIPKISPETPREDIVDLPSDSKAMHLIQQIRDEAHRFAITTHRKQRRKQKIRSRLQDIPGIGKARRLALLRQFGGLQEVSLATVDELAKVPGVSRKLAERIYEALHGS